MKIYSSLQVVTIKELKVGEVLHCGISHNKCIEWIILENNSTYAVAKSNNTLYKITGKVLRQILLMFRSEYCPVCSAIKSQGQPMGAAVSAKASLNNCDNYSIQSLEAAPIRSALSRVENYSYRGRDQGGASIVDQRGYASKVAGDIVKRFINLKT